MNIILITLLIYISLTSVIAAPYEVKKDASKIEFGIDPAISKNDKDYVHSAACLKFVSFSLPSVSSSVEHKSFSTYGLSFSKKMNNEILGKAGFLEYGFDISKTFDSSKYEKVNIFNLNLIQNFNILRAYQNQIAASVGAGISGIYLVSEETKDIRSSDNLGVSFILKSELIYLINQHLLADINLLSLDFSINEDFGRIAQQNVSITSLKLGVNLDW